MPQTPKKQATPFAAKKPRIEFVIDIDFIQKHPRSTKEDGIRWAHLLIDGTTSIEYMQFVCRYHYTEEWQAAMMTELIRIAKVGEVDE